MDQNVSKSIENLQIFSLISDAYEDTKKNKGNKKIIKLLDEKQYEDI